MYSQGFMRALLGLGFAYAVLGAILYLAPGWAAPQFAWKVSPFVTMTIGGWCLGTAWTCFTVARRNHWHASFCSILYLALFGVFQTAVLIAFRERLVTNTPLALWYVTVIAGTGLFALMTVAELRRHRPVIAVIGRKFGSLTTSLVVVFILLVAFLGAYGLLAQPGWRGLNATIFPEVLTPFSLRAFGSFYLSLALAVIPMLWSRGYGNLLNHAYALYGLLVTITLAAFVYMRVFDFTNRPTQAVYIGIYLAVGIVLAIYLYRHGTGKPA